MEALLDQISDGFLAVDREWRVLFINRTAEPFFGASREELIGRCLWEAFPRSVGTDYYHAYRRAMETGQMECLETHYSLTGLWLHIRAHPVADGLAIFYQDITARKQAEALQEQREAHLHEALLASEAKFRGLFESNVLPMGYWHEDGRILDANDAYLELVRCTREELEAGAVRWDTLTPAEYQARDSAAVEELRSGRITSSPYEKEYVLPDGTHLPVLVARSLLPGHTDQGVGVVVDLTQQKQAEEALRTSQERYRWLVETTSESVWRFELEEPVPVDLPETEQVDRFYRHAYMAECNEGTARLYGYPSAEAMVGLRLGDLLVREDPANEEYLRAFVRSGYRLVDAESVEVDEQGRTHYFLNNLVGTVEAGCVVRAWGASRDVTERRLAEEELRISRERLELVLRSVELGLWYCDLPFSRLEWNDRCKEHFGLPPDAEVTIETFFQCLHPEDREPVRRAIEDAIKGGGLFDYDYRTVDATGRVRWIRAIGSAFYDAAGVARRFDGITVDVTEQRRTLEQLAEADQRKNDFLAMLAHELRNPLSPIVNSVQLLRFRSSGDPTLDRHRDIIERQVRHMARLIDDLLDVSRINLGKVELRLEPADFRTVVNEAVETARPAVDARKQELFVQVPGEPVPLYADAARLQQVVSNLLTNACKYTPAGGRIELSLKLEEEPKRSAVLRVRDTGIGMEPALLARVFDLFAQGDQGLARSEGGLGIGLTMVRNLVEMHSGTVRAHSEGPGRGSEFEVRLPLAPSLAPASPFGSEPLPAGDDGGVRRVLVVDDNADARETLAEMLDGWGYEVRSAPDGPAALRIASEFSPEAVLLDIGMPGMDGYEVARRLGGERRAVQPVLIALTGYAQEDHLQRSEEAGFRHHLTKPIPPERLHELLRGLRTGAPDTTRGGARR